MSSKRKSTLAIVAIAISVLLLAGLTVAYLTNSFSAKNLLGIGIADDSSSGSGSGSSSGIKLSIGVAIEEPEFEKQALANSGTVVKDKGELKIKAPNLKPGDGIKKDPTIVNVGADDFYLRVRFIDVTQHTQFDELGLEINLATASAPGFKYFAADGCYYYVEDSSQTTSLAVAPGTRIPFFKTAADGTSMTIPKDWDYDDVLDFMKLFDPTATTLNFIEMNIRAEVIQTGEFSGAISWLQPDGVTPYGENDIKFFAL